MRPLAPSPLSWPTWVRLAVVAAAVAGASACIIGPKQDDPEAANIGDLADSALPPADDAGTKTGDTSTGPFNEAGAEADAALSDTVAPLADTGGCMTDASDAGDGGASPCGDGGRDAVAAD